MIRFGRILLGLLLCLALSDRQCFTQYYYYFDSRSDAEMEIEALIEALDEFDLELDSPELEGMDEGEVWEYIDGLRRNKVSHDEIFK